MDKLVIDRKKWYRGKGSTESRLLREDGQMCCLGFDMLRRGFTEDQILDAGTPEEVDGLEGEIDGLVFLQESDDDGTNYYSPTETNEELVTVNDDEGVDEADRERAIKNLFASIDVEVEFVG